MLNTVIATFYKFKCTTQSNTVEWSERTSSPNHTATPTWL